MNEKLQSAFQNAKYEPNVNLADNIWHKIIIRNKRIAFIKTSAFSTLGALSLFGLIPVSQALFTEFTKSGFYEYFSLMFSGNVSSYWKDLAYSMAESLPITNIIYTFVLVFILFLSIKYVVKQIIKNKMSIVGQSLLSF
ncbi:MAG: hypothetical protein WCI41_00475 [bacterium]